MIYTFKDFHELLRQPTSYSLFAYADEASKETKYYHNLSINKKHGGIRTLQVPCKKLKWLQRRLLPIFNHGEVSPCAFAYRKDSSVLKNAQPHIGQKMLVKLDIENFFGSITFPQVFHAIDYALTKVPNIGAYLHSQNYNSELSWYFTKICTLKGSLPQGAPTSPMLSNMVFFSLDNNIESYCKKHQIRYTRYSDDLTFSGDFSPSSLIAYVRRILSEHGFLLNEDKTVIAGSGKKHLVTGAVVNEKAQAQRNYRRKIRQEMYFISKYGINEHLKSCGNINHCDEPESQIKKLQRLLGQIDFVLQLDEQNSEFIAYKKDCMHLLSFLPYL